MNIIFSTLARARFVMDLLSVRSYLELWHKGLSSSVLVEREIAQLEQGERKNEHIRAFMVIISSTGCVQNRREIQETFHRNY